VISQDTSAYGIDLERRTWPWHDGEIRADMTSLAAALGQLGAWVRLHYVYPYPHVDRVIPLMAEGLVLPYLDIPFQHASPKVFEGDAAAGQRGQGALTARPLARDGAGHRDSILLRRRLSRRNRGGFHLSARLLDEAQLDRVGAFRFEPVAGAPANELPDPVPEELKEERYARLMEKTAAISTAKARRQGRQHHRG